MKAASAEVARKSTVTAANIHVVFSGLSPQFVGVNQINVVVPAVQATGVVPLPDQLDGTAMSLKPSWTHLN
jgi:uncharacterized protein (TIGR03437 family)